MDDWSKRLASLPSKTCIGFDGIPEERVFVRDCFIHLGEEATAEKSINKRRRLRLLMPTLGWIHNPQVRVNGRTGAGYTRTI